ncbi:MAG TPA: hypothetical protein VG937_11640 [Polyangiaceae bacterium]|jgi:hypothetical protein|nr:hypothetical protein [Polyangiaceae bacterium]
MLRELVRSLLASLVVVSSFAACTTEVGEGEGEESVGSVAQKVVNGYTSWTSEEFPPLVCDGASLIDEMNCSGSNCDNMRAYCTPSGGTRGSSTWTSYFSEEGTNYRYCGANQWVTSIACTGGYCDNISLLCTTISGVTPRDCHWTGWMSEENGGALYFGFHYFMRGAQCSGSNCDNLRYYVCTI